jgi:hypothetical protein
VCGLHRAGVGVHSVHKKTDLAPWTCISQSVGPACCTGSGDLVGLWLWEFSPSILNLVPSRMCCRGDWLGTAVKMGKSSQACSTCLSPRHAGG